MNLNLLNFNSVIDTYHFPCLLKHLRHNIYWEHLFLYWTITKFRSHILFQPKYFMKCFYLQMFLQIYFWRMISAWLHFSFFFVLTDFWSICVLIFFTEWFQLVCILAFFVLTDFWSLCVLCMYFLSQLLNYSVFQDCIFFCFLLIYCDWYILDVFVTFKNIFNVHCLLLTVTRL